MRINGKANLLFFDKPAVTQAVSAAARKQLSKAGAFVRQTAKNSIKSARKSKRKKVLSQSKRAKAKRAKSREKKPSERVSKPGNPPFSHIGTLKKRIFFAWDAVSQSVVVGPTANMRAEAPKLLEFGGTVTRRGKVLNYAARPFMGPALEKNVGLFAGLFHDSIKRQGS